MACSTGAGTLVLVPALVLEAAQLAARPQAAAQARGPSQRPLEQPRIPMGVSFRCLGSLLFWNFLDNLITLTRTGPHAPGLLRYG